MAIKTKQTEELKNIIEDNFPSDEISEKFIKRIEEGNIAKDENPKSHFCVYFAVYDPNIKQVFIGHHKKTGLWLFNGGHIDSGETIQETLIREIDEEWGLDGNDFTLNPPALLTITEINNPTKQPCNFHYDLWCFVNADKNNFNPVESNLLEEFHEAGWKNLSEARKLIIAKNNLTAIDFIENNYFKKI